MPGEPRCRLCALITLRAEHSDLEFAAPRDADLPDEGRAYVEHVTTRNSGFAARAIRRLSNLLGTCYGASVGAQSLANESIASEGDEASMAGAQGCLPAKSARERAIGSERSRISEKIVKRS